MTLLFPLRTRAALLLVPMVLAGCVSLPRSGPTAPEVERISRIPARLIDIDADTVAAAPLQSGAGSLAGLAAIGDTDRIGPGDILQVSVFEVGAALFAAPLPSGSQPGAGGTSLPPILVDADGTVVVPYAGRITAAGETPQSLARAIEARLVGYSQHAQVNVMVRESVANAVFVLGGVKTPGRVPLSAGREHLLDAVGLAGGTTYPVQDTVLRFTRGGRSGEIGLDALRVGTPDDLQLLPGDRIEVLRPVQSFTVFGASDKVSEIPFEMRNLTLAQAVARAGGPSDRQADATAVFVFRWAPGDRPDQPQVPVVYRLNMMRPESYLFSQRFAMRNGDVLYIANARSNQATKIVQILNALFSPFFGIRELTR
jgi:polysaccharide biosynthesis/export protein